MASEYKIIGGKLDGSNISNLSLDNQSIDEYKYDKFEYFKSYPYCRQEYKIDKENKTITFVRDIPIV